MKQFYVKDGQFWLDDAPLFIHAGEFHYFRTPADQWAHRLGLLKAAGFNAVVGGFKFNTNGFPIQDFHVFEVIKDSAGRVSLKTIATPLKAHRDAYVGECKL